MFKEVSGQLVTALYKLKEAVIGITAKLNSCSDDDQRNVLLDGNEDDYLKTAAEVMSLLSVTFAEFNSDEATTKGKLSLYTVKALISLPDDVLASIGIDSESKAEIEQQLLSGMSMGEDNDIDTKVLDEEEIDQ